MPGRVGAIGHDVTGVAGHGEAQGAVREMGLVGPHARLGSVGEPLHGHGRGGVRVAPVAVRAGPPAGLHDAVDVLALGHQDGPVGGHGLGVV